MRINPSKSLALWMYLEMWYVFGSAEVVVSVWEMVLTVEVLLWVGALIMDGGWEGVDGDCNDGWEASERAW